MTFKVAARTILQLGSELISSDSIAFYELIKNGFDAGSKRVTIEFLIRIPSDAWDNCHAAFTSWERSGSSSEPTALQSIRETLFESVDRSAPHAENLVDEIELASTFHDLRTVFQNANTIVVRDSGSGMSQAILADAFLTIGTRYRRVEREGAGGSSTGRVILGDKGVGRLSVMRLGSQLLVKTTQEGDGNWHELRIDWEVFSHDSDLLLSDIPVAPTEGTQKEDSGESGTDLHIWGLVHSWTREQVEDIARTEFARFMDPFAPRHATSIYVTYNGSGVSIPRFDRLLFDNAHATLSATFISLGSQLDSEAPLLTGIIDYRTENQKTEFRIDPLNLASISRSTVSVVRDIGPFQLELYWWNRRLLRAIEGIGNIKLVRALLNRWSGGVAVYRDGFRVNPYGGTDDDWLDLDKDAFAAPGYKLNRAQLVAKLIISRDANPQLVDQTNREGLQHNAHFLALRAIVKHVLEEKLRSFLDESDRQARLSEIEPLKELEARTKRSGRRVRASLRQLKNLAPQVAEEVGILDDVERLLKEIDETFRNARLRVQAHQEERERLVGLAGTGLMVEIVAHELHRATTHALTMVTNAAEDPSLVPARTVLTILGAQLKTLRTRLSVLDELSVSGRQVKTSFNLIPWVRGILENHHPQFERHHIKAVLISKPLGADEMRVRMVRGMVVQILENLLSNSVYWLSVQRREEPDFKPQISIIVDVSERTLTFVDNGPGIDMSRADEVFLPFATTKPPGDGSGLGLYIAREIANYHGASLRLSPEPALHPGRLNAFILSLAKVDD